MATHSAFENPCTDYIEKRLNIHEYLVGDQEEATYYVRFRSQALINLGIYPNTVLVVNKAIHYKEGDLLMAWINGEFKIRILGKDENGNTALLSANPEFKPIIIKDGTDFQTWGVITGLARRLSP
jgi:DNA polymerase V